MSFRVSPQGDAGRGVGEGLEGQWTLLGAEVCVGQGGVQREQVGWWGQDLGPLGIRENGIVRPIWKREENSQLICLTLSSIKPQSLLDELSTDSTVALLH